MIKTASNLRILLRKQIELIYFPFRKIVPAETFRYGVTGGLNVSLDIMLYFIFYNFILQRKVVNFGLVAVSPHIAAFLFVFPITFTTGFLLARHITFTESSVRGRIQLFRYAVSVGGSIILNYVLLKLFVEYLKFWPTFSKMIITVFVVAYSYVVQKFYTFKTQSNGA